MANVRLTLFQLIPLLAAFTGVFLGDLVLGQELDFVEEVSLGDVDEGEPGFEVVREPELPAVDLETPTAVELPEVHIPSSPPRKSSPSQLELRKKLLDSRGIKASGPSGPARLKLESTAKHSANDAWRRSLEAGFSLQRGNTENDLYLLRAEVRRKKGKAEFLMNAQGQYGESAGERNRESASGKIRYNHDLSTNSYHSLETKAYYDALAELDYQIIATWSYGYRIINEKNALLAIEIGPGFLAERKSGQTDGYLAGHLAENGEVRINDKVIIWHAVDYFPSLEEFSRFVLTAEAGIETELTGSLRFRTAIQDRYDSEPATDKEKNDLAMIVSLAIGF